MLPDFFWISVPPEADTLGAGRDTTKSTPLEIFAGTVSERVCDPLLYSVLAAVLSQLSP